MALVLRILQCCTWCLERFIEFLTKNAYIQVALKGTNFCKSAKEAWRITLANMIRFGVVAVLGRVINKIGLLFIMAATTILGWYILQLTHADVTPVVPMASYVFMSYLVAKLFMGVFGMAVDTCLQCVIEAESMDHDGGFVPASLKKVLPDKTPNTDEAKAAWGGKGGE